MTRDSSSRARTAEAITQWLVTRVAELSGIASEEIEVQQPFAAYGLGSRDAVVLSGELEEWLRRPVDPTLMYDYPCIEDLARSLAAAQDDVQGKG